MKMVQCMDLYGKTVSVPVEKLILRPAVYAIIIKEEKILLFKVKNSKKYWLPGGEIEKGEPLAEALRRECQEECGMNLHNLTLLTVAELFYYHNPYDNAYQNISFIYRADTDKIIIENIHLEEDEEISLPVWVNINELKEEDCHPNLWKIFNLIDLKAEFHFYTHRLAPLAIRV